MGEYVLGDKAFRWLLFFLPLAAGFFVFNRTAYPASPLIEFPGRVPRNGWVEAFDWARRNTPENALFALNPNYMSMAGEDRHGFRAFAERSVLADASKDRSVAGLSPELANQWKFENQALQNWSAFTMEDFIRLKRRFGVQWILLERNHQNSATALQTFSCPYRNDVVAVCQIP